MDVVLNFISDIFHAYWFYVAWGTFWGIVYCLVETEEEDEKKRTKISIRKPIDFAQQMWKRRRDHQNKCDQGLEEEETKQTKLSIRKPIAFSQQMWKRRRN